MTTAHIRPFFDAATFTYSYVVSDPATRRAAIIDPVLDYDPAASRLSTESADRIVDYVTREGLTVDWILETHIHADHLTAAYRLRSRLGGKLGIGANVVEVQEIFAGVFNLGDEFARDGSQFDVLLEDGATFEVGSIETRVLSTPGHTPACVTYVFPGAAFVGDTIFMPDYGTARTDFPGGDAAVLYASIRRILELPADTRLYMCHDYGTPERSAFRYETTVAEERESNKLIHDGIAVDRFVAERNCRDAKLDAPKLLLPSVQFNMRGGQLPPAEDNGVHYFKVPVRGA